VAERQAALTERTLDTEVRKPADAARYKKEQEAQASRNAVQFEAEGRSKASVADAQAAAERVRLSSLAEAERVRISSEVEAGSVRVAAEAELARRTAQANATRLEGEAQATAIEARGRADALARKESAAAFEQYGDAARLQMVVEVLPAMAEALAAPLGSISDLTVISNDGAGQLSRSVANNLHETLETVLRTTGVDIRAMLKSATDGAAQPARHVVTLDGQE
jgi:flotillin